MWNMKALQKNGSQDIERKPILHKQTLWAWPLTYWTQNHRIHVLIETNHHVKYEGSVINSSQDIEQKQSVMVDGGTDGRMDGRIGQKQYVSPKLGGDINIYGLYICGDLNSFRDIKRFDEMKGACPRGPHHQCHWMCLIIRRFRGGDLNCFRDIRSFRFFSYIALDKQMRPSPPDPPPAWPDWTHWALLAGFL